jgi:hypothetical protein
MDAVLMGYPFYYVGWQGTFPIGHAHSNEHLAMGLYPVAQGSGIHPGISRQLLSCHGFHNVYFYGFELMLNTG